MRLKHKVNKHIGMKRNPIRFAVMYIAKHIKRTIWKSLLVMLLAALLMSAISQFAKMKLSYVELFENTEITANAIGEVHLAIISTFADSGYVSDLYYARSVEMDIAMQRTMLIVTNKIRNFTGDDVEITFADGYDDSTMSGFGEVMVLGRTLIANSGIRLGDKVDVLPAAAVSTIRSATISRYRNSFPDDTISDAEILDQSSVQMQIELERETRRFTVVGELTSASGEYDRMAFTPGTKGSSIAYGSGAALEIAQFQLADNYRAEEFRKFGEAAIGHNVRSGTLFIMDTSRLENTGNTVRLLTSLFPFAIVAALLIGGFLCCLIILQSAKELALMRMLGTTRIMSCVVPSLEHSSLCIIGLALGIYAMLAFNGFSFSFLRNEPLLFVTLFFAMILFCGIICSALATRKPPLELLQVRE